MHPAYRSDKPGVAPDCGMQLEPVYAGDGVKPQYRRDPMPPGTVQVSPEQQHDIGVKTERIARNPGSHVFRLTGRVALDETRVYRVAAAIDGWVRKVGPIVAGSIIKKDEVLATFYSREFLTAQQTYLYALDTMDRYRKTESTEQLKLTGAQIRASEENLESLGMSETQRKEVARTREIAREIELRSPVNGLLTVRNASPGLRFDRGAELFRICDLSRAWIFADVFENDAWIIGMAKSATVRYQGKMFPVRMSAGLPQFDAASRALKVRFEMDNPGFLLRPDMFVDVELQVDLPPAVTAPEDAVLSSGLKKTVFVDRGDGFFEPRQVETGWRAGDRVQIIKGLEPGERIVVAGNFLLDSESRMKAAASPGGAGPARDAACGMEIDPAKAAARTEYKGKTYYFCSKNCKEKFDRDPATYSNRVAWAGGHHD